MYMKYQIKRTPADYADMLTLPHHQSKRHPPMSQQNRAAQFAPFAALTGHTQLLVDIQHQVAEAHAPYHDSPGNAEAAEQNITPEEQSRLEEAEQNRV